MLKTRRFLAVVTVVAGATLGGLTALAAPLWGSLGGLPEAAVLALLAQLQEIRRITDQNVRSARDTRGGTAELARQASTLAGSLGGLPEVAGGSSVVVKVGWWNCWYKYGCKYCKYCYYKYGEKYCGDVSKTCKKRGGYYY